MTSWWFPPTLAGYQRSWLLRDGLAGLALAAVAVPSQMATARLAGLPVADGLYAFLAGSVLYALIGTHPDVSVGADSTIAPVLATAVAMVATVGSGRYGSLMALTGLFVGALLIAIGLLRLGWISAFLSTPVIVGILAGIAVEIIVRQIPSVLGVDSGGTTTVGRIRDLAHHLGHINGWSIGIALGVFVLILGGRQVDRRFPGALVGVVLSITLVEVLSLGSRHGVATVGHVSAGVPHFGLTTAPWAQVRKLLEAIFTVTFVCIAQTAATVRTRAQTTSNKSNFNRDLIAVGAGSVAAGLIGTLPVDASPPNSELLSASGVRSQLANILAAFAVLIVIVSATGQLAHLPQATLAATLVYVASRLFHVGELRTILNFDRVEFALTMATLLTVALVGIEQGVAVAIVLSLADRTWKAARPNDALLGREPGTDHWIPVDVGQMTEQPGGILVYLVYAPLWYGNADYVAHRLRQLVTAAPHPVQTVIIDADAMSDIDFTGMQALRQLSSDFQSRGITMEIARPSHLVHHDLKHGALLDQIGPDHLFPSVEEAVMAVRLRQATA